MATSVPTFWLSSSEPTLRVVLNQHLGPLTALRVISLATEQLTCPRPTLRHQGRTHLWISGVRRGCEAPDLTIVDLQHVQPSHRLSYETLREEPAIRCLDWSFAPISRSDERFAGQHRFGLPPPFQGASPCPEIDQHLSGLFPTTSGPFLTRATRAPGRVSPGRLRRTRFRCAFGGEPLRLAGGKNSRGRVSRRTNRRC